LAAGAGAARAGSSAASAATTTTSAAPSLGIAWAFALEAFHEFVGGILVELCALDPADEHEGVREELLKLVRAIHLKQDGHVEVLLLDGRDASDAVFILKRGSDALLVPRRRVDQHHRLHDSIYRNRVLISYGVANVSWGC
jgi:hypothetical protein